ncbi:UDP-N-acetylmuramoyl-tripeptide--D-alanyl-D-alanine ligase [Aggregicoccus sp. 17bor-14]|uniref:UDP-N-acetylmuramoyl-tripeptide--D-alanyl-D- alanine ligase n=1 Tax=Myxococcaceae TaxID=31 RepID=UPI00129C39FA|nr:MULTISPECIES: UDP-N-acetylmuramoyl-tripeptide--D-alanyl-D-alanine ligase [Myxococcaceae]MBF5044409.1 UDP-N-acetylmuramoyl-tripeptide--D-alanyl-D-alanine ligase [Simulacricoccus sp. 17bor-14]MRI90156.1 UDP-N-acetylmuramoyl-tripeptide--D-alanyl-D-alanine ligase [Aggregicoccus sp. 17bor-14]
MAVRLSDEQVVQATGATRAAPGARAAYEAVCTDTRALTPGCLFVALEGERFDAHTFLPQAAASGAAGALVKRGKPLPPGIPAGFALYAVDDTLAGLGALARFHRQRFRIPVGAVGGSNGKTTTKEMVGAILAVRGPALKTEGNLNNEVGVPLTLFRLEPSHVAAVIEVGMNRPGEISRLARVTQPDAGLITIVQPEHLEGLGSLEGVADAEAELFQELSPQATAVVNLDDPLIAERAQRTQARRLTFGRAAESDVRLAGVRLRGRAGMTATVRHAGRDWEVELAFVGEHNALNATGAFALALALGYRPEECVAGLASARPYARRLNVVDAPGGVTVVDDCYNANPASMNAALDTLVSLTPEGGRAFAVLGDMLELGAGEQADHTALGERVVGRASRVAFFGPRSVHGLQAARAGGMGDGAAHFTEVEPLVAWLKPQLREGDVVLVKASRGMRLERVVAALTGQAPAGGGH